MTTNTPEGRAAARKIMADEFRATIARLQADARTDQILAWPSIGLAVKFHQDIPGNQVVVCNLELASPIEPNAWTPRITNGHGDEAQRMPRAQAIAAQIANLLDLIATLESEETEA